MKHSKIQLDLKRMIGFRLVPTANRGASFYAAKISQKVGDKNGAKIGAKIGAKTGVIKRGNR